MSTAVCAFKELGERQDIAVRVGEPGHLVAAGQWTSRHGQPAGNLAITILRLTGHASIAADENIPEPADPATPARRSSQAAEKDAAKETPDGLTL